MEMVLAYGLHFKQQSSHILTFFSDYVDLQICSSGSHIYLATASFLKINHSVLPTNLPSFSKPTDFTL